MAQGVNAGIGFTSITGRLKRFFRRPVMFFEYPANVFFMRLLLRRFYQFTLTARPPSRFSSSPKSSALGVTAHFGAMRNWPDAASLP